MLQPPDLPSRFSWEGGGGAVLNRHGGSSPGTTASEQKSDFQKYSTSLKGPLGPLAGDQAAASPPCQNEQKCKPLALELAVQRALRLGGHRLPVPLLPQGGAVLAP